jgi:hypothetical protein
MKKHLFGFAIFSFIVGTAIFASVIFNAPKEVMLPAVEPVPYETIKTSCWQTEEQTTAKTVEAPLSYTLQDVSWDAEKNLLRAKIQIFWHGNGNQPKAVNYKINFFTADQPEKSLLIAEDTVQSPFEGRYAAAKNITFFVKMRGERIDPKKNYYAYVDLGSFEQEGNAASGTFSGRLTRVVLNESEKLAKAAPVTIFQEK